MSEGRRTDAALALQDPPVDLFETLRAFDPGGFAEVAKRSGVPLPSLYEFANTKHLRAPWKVLNKVAPVLGMKPAELAELWTAKKAAVAKEAKTAAAAKARKRRPRG